MGGKKLCSTGKGLIIELFVLKPSNQYQILHIITFDYLLFDIAVKIVIRFNIVSSADSIVLMPHMSKFAIYHTEETM